jgi:CheY-like chemotaxis protein/anti-sigma regulatory factor (Ser/Thr protein kinase)
MHSLASKVRMLVVDDEPGNIEIIRAYLEAPDIEIAVAHDGLQAWSLLEDVEQEYDLLILDRMMPRLDGMEVLRRIRRTPRLRALPVIMQTAAATPDQVREGLQAGARYYLTKHYEPDALLAIAKTALDEVRRTRETQLRVDDMRSAMITLISAEFEFATLDQATQLSSLASLAAPQPENIVMGLSELLINAVEHGNLGITYEEKSRLRMEDRWQEEVEARLLLPQHRDKRAHLQVLRSADEIRYVVTDQGSGFDFGKYLDFDPERAFDPNGRGISMARQLCFQSLEYIGCGNVVHATVAIP